MDRPICVSGFPGSGKSTLCYRLAEHLDLPVVSAGSIMREIAASRGITVTELNLASEASSELDNLIDQTIKSKASEVNCILDSRMAWYFVEDCIKVFLEVSSDEAAIRAMSRPASREESYSDLEAARIAIAQRRNSETKRYSSFYSVDISDENHFDLYVFTDLLSADDVYAIVLNYLAKEHTGSEQYASPGFLIPTREIEEINADDIAAVDVDDLPTVQVVRLLDRLLVREDHATVAAAIKSQVPYIKVRTTETAAAEATAGQRFQTLVSPSLIQGWEDTLGYTSNFNYKAFGERL